MVQQNGLFNQWLDRRLFNFTIKSRLLANNHFSEILNCMTDVFKMEKEFQLNKIQFFKVTSTGLRILFYIILGGLALSIVILLGEITVFFKLNCV